MTGLTEPGWLQSSSKRFRVAVEGHTSTRSLTMPQDTCTLVHAPRPGVTAACRTTPRSQEACLCHLSVTYLSVFMILDFHFYKMRTCRKGSGTTGPYFGVFCQTVLRFNIADTPPGADT